MSALEELDALERNVRQRIAALKPAHQEWTELMRVAERLGIDPEAVDASNPSSASPTPRRRKAQTRRRRTPTASSAAPARSKTSTAPSSKSRSAEASRPKRTPGASRGGPTRAAQIADLIGKRPGLTVAELGSELGVDPTGLYRPIRRLENEGQIRKNGAKLELAS